MIYPENIVINELVWEYDYTKRQSEAIVDYYKKRGKYQELCELIQYRLSIQILKEEQAYV